MYAKGRKKDTTRFAVMPEGPVRRVEVAGDFSGWQPLRMRKQKDGSFAAAVPLAPGSYEYKFLLDGQWALDPDNPAWAANPYGSLNSVAVVT